IVDGLEKAPASFLGMLQGKKLRQDAGQNGNVSKTPMPAFAYRSVSLRIEWAASPERVETQGRYAVTSAGKGKPRQVNRPSPHKRKCCVVIANQQDWQSIVTPIVNASLRMPDTAETRGSKRRSRHQAQDLKQQPRA